jgi:hypothetical protein
MKGHEVPEFNGTSKGSGKDGITTPEALPPVRRWVRIGRVLGMLLVVVILVVAILIHRAAHVVKGVAVQGVAAGDSTVGAPPVASPAFPEIAGRLVGTTVLPGHRVTLLTDTQLFETLFADLAAARRSITFFAYYCEPGASWIGSSRRWSSEHGPASACSSWAMDSPAATS